MKKLGLTAILLLISVFSYSYDDVDPIEKKVDGCYSGNSGATAESLDCSSLGVRLYDEGSRKYIKQLLNKASAAEKARITQDQANWEKYAAIQKKSADLYLDKLQGSIYMELVAAHHMTLSKDRYFHLKFLATLRETSLCPMDEC